MSAVLPSTTDSFPLTRPSPTHPRQLPNSSDMQRNYAFATLPSYLRNSRRETIKTDVARDTTAYANIRQKISTTSLTVPYEKGLDTLRALQRSNNTSSAELGSILKLQKRRTDTITYNRISAKQIINDVLTPGGRQSPRTRIGSEGGSSVRSTESKLSKVKAIRARLPGRKDRLESETSSNASRSRPTSYTSWYTDDSLWSDKLVEIKERYADNSDFITSMRRDKGDDKCDIRSDVTSEADLSPRLEKNIYSPHKIKIKHSKKKIPKLKKAGFLPTIPIHDEELRSGDGSWSSHTGSSKSAKVNVNFLIGDNHGKSFIPKRRKVEFNLKPKRTVRLPPIPSKKETKVRKKPKSILKKYDDAFDDLPPFLSPSPSPAETREENVTSSWQVHLPRLRSPIPSARRQAMSFQRQSVKVKCSKEFETVASDIQSDKNET